MRSRLVFVLLMLVMSAPAAVCAELPRAARPSPVKTTPTSPTRAVKAFAECYDKLSVESLANLLTADYRFHFCESQWAGSEYAQGFGRDRELAAARSLFQKFEVMKVTVGDLELGLDPEHPDSTSHYQVVVAHRMPFSFRMKGASGTETIRNDTRDQTFYLVRGDAAVVAPGHPASADRWYIRRWFEDQARVQARLGEADGRCEAPTAPEAMPGPDDELSLRALDSPLCPTLEVACALPGAEPATLEVFDVAGRRMARRELVPTSAGSTLQVEAGSGMRFAPGAYFLRLTQGQRPPSRKMVLVAK